MNAELQNVMDEAVQTLGDLLYVDESRLRVPEKDWTDLLQQVAGGDTKAFGSLYMWTHGIVFALAMRITKQRTTAELVTVKVFEDLWHESANYDAASGTVAAWIMNLARSRSVRACGAEQ
ncbi:MAG TPA: hypothetical protein VFL16_13080 [Steroidobacteraceae bacterium]|nr:hypothetical protein [Steroidobacteraceae bacterium]